MSEDFTSYFGFIEVTKIENLYSEDNLESINSNAKPTFSSTNVKSVHYDDCQQLVIWLEEYYTSYKNLEIIDTVTKSVIYNEEIGNIVSGSTQIILDSLFIYPGEFKIQINKINNSQHFIYFRKYVEGIFPEQIPPANENNESEDKEPIVYRDGFGNLLPNEDLIMRDQIIRMTINKVFRRLEFLSHGREGEVIYIEGDRRVHFYMELGAYNCLFYLVIPSPENWESSTPFALEERDDILRYIAEGTLREQAPSCIYKISDCEITYFKKNG